MAENTTSALERLSAPAEPTFGQRVSELLFSEPPPGVGPPGEAKTLPEPPAGLSIRAYPTVGEKATEVGYGLLEGLTRTAPATTGGIIGFRTGMQLAPLMGPYAPLGVVGSTMAGVVSGIGMGNLLQNEFDIKFPGVSRQDLVPYREGGKTWSDTIAIAPLAFNIPVSQTQRLSEAIRLSLPAAKRFGMEGVASASRFFTDVLAGIGRTAQKYPKSFLTAEVVSGAGAGLGAGIAEETAPGEPGTRLLAEVTGGVLAPSRLFIHLGSAKALLGNIGAQFSKDAREARAANKLYSILQDAGEDVNKVIRALEANVPGKARPTAGQKTGVRVLSILENTLARENAKYGEEIAEQANQTFKAYQLLAENLSDVGTPQALRAAAQLRQEAFNAMLDNRQGIALANAAQKIRNISKDTPEARLRIGEIVRDATYESLSDARKHERFLWDDAVNSLRTPSVVTTTERVPSKILGPGGKPLTTTKEVTRVKYPTITPDSTGQKFLEEVLELDQTIYRNTVPKIVKDIMARIGVDDKAIALYRQGPYSVEFAETKKIPAYFMPKMKEIEVPDLVNLRSNLLELSRNAAIKGDNNEARFYGNLANSMLDDLSKVKSTKLDEARDFSRTLNDYFTRSFAGKLLRKDSTGAMAYPPEVLVQRAYGAENDIVAQRMADIEDAVSMLGREYTDAVNKFGLRSAQAQSLKPLADLSEGRVVSIRDAHERVLRLAAAESIDPNTGRVSVTKLARFVERRKPLLERLQITADLTDAVKAENAMKAVMAGNSFMQKSLRNQTAFAQVLKFESPTMAVADVLNSSRHPAQAFARITQLAKAGGPDAVEGLKSSIYDYAFTKAGGDKGFSPQAFKEAFFSPIRNDKSLPSIYNILRSQGMMTLTEGKNLKRIIEPMLRVEQALADRQLMAGVIQGADAATELALRVVGAKLGSTLHGQGPGSLVAASKGSSYMREMFDKSPMMMVRGIIEEATKDPQMMALLLRKGVTEGEKLRLARQMHAYLTAAGLNYERFTEPPPEPTVQAPPVQRSVMPRRQPATVSTRGVPGLNLGGGGPQTVGPQPAAGGNSREMLKRLFPFDTTIQ